MEKVICGNCGAETTYDYKRVDVLGKPICEECDKLYDINECDKCGKTFKDDICFLRQDPYSNELFGECEEEYICNECYNELIDSI